MSWLHALLGSAVSLVLFALALLVIGSGFSAVSWHNLIESLDRGRLPCLLAALAVAGMTLAYWATFWPARRRSGYVTISREGGTVSVSLAAVAEQIMGLASEFPQIVKMRPQTRAARGALELEMDVRVVEGTDIGALSQALQNRVRQKLSAALGPVEIRRVNVRVTHFHSG